MNIQDATSGLHFLSWREKLPDIYLSDFETLIKETLFLALWWFSHGSMSADDDKNNLNIFSILWHLRSTRGISKTEERRRKKTRKLFSASKNLHHHQKSSKKFLVKYLTYIFVQTSQCMEITQKVSF